LLDELQTAIDGARPGDMVELEDRQYVVEGANNSNGVIFALLTWGGQRWVTLAQRLVRPGDGTVSIVQDISQLYRQQRTLILAADANGNTSWDWAHWVEAVIEVDGLPAIDLIEQAPAAYWHSLQGAIPWGTSSAIGTATYAYNIKTTDDRVFFKDPICASGLFLQRLFPRRV
jgi:hypothetical protein